MFRKRDYDRLFSSSEGSATPYDWQHIHAHYEQSLCTTIFLIFTSWEAVPWGRLFLKERVAYIGLTASHNPHTKAPKSVHQR